MSMGKRELSFGEGEKTRQLLVGDYHFNDKQAAGIVKASNETAKTVLDEVIKFEESVDTQFKEFRSDVDQRFDKVDQRFDKVDQRFDKVDQRFDKVDQRFDKAKQNSRLGLICIVLTLVGVIATVFGIEVPIFG